MSWMNAMPGTGRSLSRTVQAVIGWKGPKEGLLDRAAQLPEVLPRIALFWGSRDQTIPVEHTHALVERMENVTLTQFENCGHWPQLEHPEAFALALAQFLGEPALARARLRVPFTTPMVPRSGGLFRALWRWLRTFAAALASWLRRKRLPPP